MNAPLRLDSPVVFSLAHARRPPQLQTVSMNCSVRQREVTELFFRRIHALTCRKGKLPMWLEACSRLFYQN